jgi:hypothetical protein
LNNPFVIGRTPSELSCVHSIGSIINNVSFIVEDFVLMKLSEVEIMVDLSLIDETKISDKKLLKLVSLSQDL